jgi:hypothetical protein
MGFGLRRGGRGFGENVAAADQANLGYIVFALPKKRPIPGHSAATH